ncbi:hypothetical protein ATG_13140 [Desulfurococcaceae archaeon AG1]|nr:hypothetical protein ATG_13140 [Desulfurococcaceae archaeon AG1]
MGIVDGIRNNILIRSPSQLDVSGIEPVWDNYEASKDKAIV